LILAVAPIQLYTPKPSPPELLIVTLVSTAFPPFARTPAVHPLPVAIAVEFRIVHEMHSTAQDAALLFTIAVVFEILPLP
jgi:hypothetical protein